MKRKLTFHLLGLAHLPVSEKYMACAFTQKVVKLSKLLLDLGHTVYLYGAEGSDAPCTEFIQTHTLSDIRSAWGSGDNRFDIGYDWKNSEFRHDFNQMPKTKTTQKYYNNAVNEINKRKKDDHFLLLSQGGYQKNIAQRVGLFLTCEPGIGYRGSYAKYRAFESSYLQNFTYGSEHPRQSIRGNYYDRVIPNYFDAKDFPKEKIATKKKDYLLYVGRQTWWKGIDTAILAAQHLNKKLIIAGQGEYKKANNVEYVGYVDPEKRFQLMTEAQAVLVPTIYLEAFGGVSVEAMLSGTPVITTNFGVFPETVSEVAGIRCNTLQDFVDAIRKTEKGMDPIKIRKYAERFLIDTVKLEFEKWFQDLYQLYLSSQDKNIKAWSLVK